MPSRYFRERITSQNAEWGHQSCRGAIQPSGTAVSLGVFIYGVIKQVDDVGQLADAPFLRFDMMFAIAFLILLAGRFAYMKARTVSALPAATPV